MVDHQPQFGMALGEHRDVLEVAGEHRDHVEGETSLLEQREAFVHVSARRSSRDRAGCG